METNDGFPPGLRFEMTQPPLNIDELDAVLNYIAAHPEEWDQTTFCGTARCVAGHVVLRAGWVPTSGIHVVHRDERWRRPRLVDDVAAEILGITKQQADTLFAARNRFSTLRTMAVALRFDRNADLSRVR